MNALIEQKTSTLKTSRYYVQHYEVGLKSDKLDGEFFSTIEDQMYFFSCKLSEAKSELRQTLQVLRDLWAIERQKTKAESKGAIEIAIKGIDAELSGLDY